MGEQSERTLAAYEEHAQEWIQATGPGMPAELARWLERAVAGLDGRSRILDVGSGSGRDADWLEARGWRVQRSDACEAFCQEMENAGHDVLRLDVLDGIPAGWDVILADAVLLHFPHEQACAVMMDAAQALNPGGRFALTLKVGHGEVWSKEKLGASRFFALWQAGPLFDALTQAGFSRVCVDESPSWLHAVAYR